jgi:hypothetical protein
MRHQSSHVFTRELKRYISKQHPENGPGTLISVYIDCTLSREIDAAIKLRKSFRTSHAAIRVNN